MREAVESAFPQTEYQRCLIHQVRSTMKYVVEKDRKEFAADLKTIYQAPDESHALEAGSVLLRNGDQNMQMQ